MALWTISDEALSFCQTSQMERLYCAYVQTFIVEVLFNGESLKHPAVCGCLTSRAPPTFQFPAAEVQVTIVSMVESH